MMPLYENIYISPDSTAYKFCTDLPTDVTISGVPDITLTWVKDDIYRKDVIDLGDFEKKIVTGHGVYMESVDRLAFHCGKLKFTIVKLNEREAGHIVVGNNVVLQGTAIVAYQRVTIEDNVIFGPNVTLMDSDGHPCTGRGLKDEASRIIVRPVHIKEHAWIGMGAIILKGVTVGRHAVIGAGSVVRTDVPDYAVAMGNPAKVVRYLE